MSKRVYVSKYLSIDKYLDTAIALVSHLTKFKHKFQNGVLK